MAEQLSRLLAVGFKPVGSWSLANNVLRLALEPSVMHEQDVLYAFAVDGALVYVGKTTQSLLKRMQGYRSPASNAERGGSTNIKNNRYIREALQAGSTVEIYVLHALPNQSHGEFRVNLSAGLEDSLIKTLAPPWNGKTMSAKNSSSQTVLPSSEFRVPIPSMPLTPAVSTPLKATPVSRHDVPSAESLFSFCKLIQGETLETLVRRTQFRVEVVGSFLDITPTSSNDARREGKATVAAVLARLGKTGSFQMSDYKDVSFNASYILAIVKSWQRQ
jgi:hypothetical protein